MINGIENKQNLKISFNKYKLFIGDGSYSYVLYICMYYMSSDLKKTHDKETTRYCKNV